MFWRILLLTYFATGAAWGPAFCCCRVSRLLDMGIKWTDTALAIGLAVPADGLAVPADSAVNSGKDSFSVGTCPRCRSAAERQAASRDCGLGEFSEHADPESSCPCRERGERDSGLWSFAFSGQQLVRAISWSDFGALMLSATAESELHLRNNRDGAARLLDCHPYLLYGRALLRARQTLNC